MEFRFAEMLYEMFGDDYEMMIESFLSDIHRQNKQDIGLDEMFIEFGKYLENCKIMAKAFGQE